MQKRFELFQAERVLIKRYILGEFQVSGYSRELRFSPGLNPHLYGYL